MSEPTSGMETGSDTGAPGDHLPDLPLTVDDAATLSDLLAAEDRDRAGSDTVGGSGAGDAADEAGSGGPRHLAPDDAAEGGPVVDAAAEDDSPLPVDDPSRVDPDAEDVQFRAPDDENRR